jgi:hypothetical protein
LRKFEQTYPLVSISIFKIRRDIKHFGQVSGSTFPDQVRDRLQFFDSVLTSFFGVLLMIHPVPE